VQILYRHCFQPGFKTHHKDNPRNSRQNGESHRLVHVHIDDFNILKTKINLIKYKTSVPFSEKTECVAIERPVG
jgi:hypothetical protein